MEPIHCLTVEIFFVNDIGEYDIIDGAVTGE